jgi:hypothetical protein
MKATNIPGFTAEASLNVRSCSYVSQSQYSGAYPASVVVSQSAPGFYYGGRVCDGGDHIIYETWIEVNGGPPIQHWVPVGSC